MHALAPQVTNDLVHCYTAGYSSVVVLHPMRKNFVQLTLSYDLFDISWHLDCRARQCLEHVVSPLHFASVTYGYSKWLSAIGLSAIRYGRRISVLFFQLERCLWGDVGRPIVI